jgi:hypothetical protein
MKKERHEDLEDGVSLPLTICYTKLSLVKLKLSRAKHTTSILRKQTLKAKACFYSALSIFFVGTALRR